MKQKVVIVVAEHDGLNSRLGYGGQLTKSESGQIRSLWWSPWKQKEALRMPFG